MLFINVDNLSIYTNDNFRIMICNIMKLNIKMNDRYNELIITINNCQNQILKEFKKMFEFVTNWLNAIDKRVHYLTCRMDKNDEHFIAIDNWEKNNETINRNALLKKTHIFIALISMLSSKNTWTFHFKFFKTVKNLYLLQQRVFDNFESDLHLKIKNANTWFFIYFAFCSSFFF